jgi:pyridoxal 5'-phosphate synthase pdxS subunit
MRTMMAQIRRLTGLPREERMTFAKEINAPYELVVQVAEEGRLPVVNFAAGGVATPADAALMMLLGAEGIFVGSGIFKSSNPELTARAIVKATAYYNDPAILLEASEGLGAAMKGIELGQIPEEERLARRGW